MADTHPDSSLSSIVRLNDWVQRLSRAQACEVEEIGPLCLEALVDVMDGCGGLIWVSEQDARTLAAIKGLPDSAFASLSPDTLETLWHGDEEARCVPTGQLLSTEFVEALGAHAMVLPLMGGGIRVGLVLLFRSDRSFSEDEGQIATLLGSVAYGALMSAVTRRSLRSHQRDLAESEAMAERKGRFLATMSHEIRTPLNGILGMTQLLMDTQLDAEQREFLNTVHSSAKSLLTIINDVLDFSKVDAGRLQLDPVVFDVRNMLEEVMSLVSERADPKGLDLFCLHEGSLPARFMGDEGRIRQILINLVGNAVKFTMDGQVIVRTTVESVDGEETTLRFEVEDSGIGLAPDKVGQLFQSFVQADKGTTRRFGGTGLGLAISKRLAELLGGEIGVRSERGLGSTFWFTVPLKRVAVPKRTLDFSSELRGKSMWVGAENPLTLKTLRQVLDPVGVGVHAFQHQAELEAALKEEQVDFVLLDDSGPDWRRDSLASQVAGVEGVAVLALLRNSERELCRPGPESPWRGALIRPFRGALVLHTLRGLQGVQTPQRKGAEREDVAPVTQLSRPTKILLVEDSPINRTIALKMLQKIGFEADDVHNGLEAIEACKDTEYDIVLMDCMMPVVDGYQATARIRKAFGLRRGPVIVALTANAMPEDRARSLEAGMDDHLAKPFTLEDLREKVESWISK